MRSYIFQKLEVKTLDSLGLEQNLQISEIGDFANSQKTETNQEEMISEKIENSNKQLQSYLSKLHELEEQQKDSLQKDLQEKKEFFKAMVFT